LHITGEFQISSPAYIDVQVSSIPDTSIWYKNPILGQGPVHTVTIKILKREN
jgi:hypothetical protein